MIVRIRGVNKVRSKGRTYYYHRKSGTRLESDPGTAAFLAELDRLNAVAPKVEKTGDETLAALMAAYRESPEFTQLAAETKRGYRRVMDYLAYAGTLRLTDLDEPRVIRIRDKAFTKHKRRFANYCVQVIRLMLTWSKPRGWIKVNVALDAPMIRRPKSTPKQNRAWTDTERAVVLAEATGGLKIMLALGMFAGMAEGDAVKFSRPGYDGRSLQWTRKKTDTPVWMPAHAELRVILDAAPSTFKTGRGGTGPEMSSMVFAIGAKRGRPLPFTESGFRASFRTLRVRLETEKKVQPGLTFHGLRHTLGKLLDEAGCDTKTIATMLGHRTTKMAELYSEEGDRKRRNVVAMKRLQGAGKRSKRTEA